MARRRQTDFPLGEIRADAAYTRADFLERTGKAAARSQNLSAMVQRGLEVCEDEDGRVYILGEDWIAYLKSKKKKRADA